MLSLERRHLPSFLLELLPSPHGSLFTVLFQLLILHAQVGLAARGIVPEYQLVDVIFEQLLCLGLL